MQKNTRGMTTKTMAYCALLAALSVVLARLIVPMPNAFTRFSIEAVPVVLAGLLFGPLAGGMVGFSADLVGCLFSGFGYNPIFCVPPVLYGVCAGLFRRQVAKNNSLVWLVVSIIIPAVFGSILYQSAALSYIYRYDPKVAGSFMQGMIFFLSTRSVQFAVTLVVDVIIIYSLLETRMFNRLGLWHTAKKENKKMTAEEAIAYIESVSWKGSIPGLERPQELLERMGNPEKALKYIHIGGTNGKGSTAAMTAKILETAGYKVGLYTSPHITRFHERIRVNGEDISDADLAAVTEYVKPLAEAMADAPTEFELVWCIAVEYFKRMGCDIVVTEVGMGGEMDATNVIPVPEVAVLTNIGLDHTDFLGSTLEEIATTKAGIIKEGGHAVIYPSTPSVEAVLADICQSRNVSMKKVDFSQIHSVSHSLEGQVFDCGNRKGLKLPLLGQHQLYNAAVALYVIDTLIEKGWNITEEQIRTGMAQTKWAGRFDIMGHDPLFIIDGGHNPQCLEALVKNIEDYLPGRRIVGLTGVLADKDYGDMYQPVMPLIEQFVCITPPSDRKLEATELAEHLRQTGAKATACDTIEQGVQLAKQLAGKDGVVLCFGSLYSISDIQKAL